MWAADVAPNGICQLEVRAPPGGAILPSFISCWKVASHSVRKHSTWRAMPVAMAIMAAITEPPGPKVSMPPLIHVGRRPERALQRGHPALAHARDVESRVSGQPVDVVERQSGVGDRGFARVDGQRQRRHHQPAAEPGHADAGDGRVSSNFSVVSIGATCLPKSVGAISSSGSGPGLFVGGRPEHRQPDSPSMLLEVDLDGLAQLELVGFAVDDVGGQPNSRILHDRRPGPPRTAAADRESRTGG